MLIWMTAAMAGDAEVKRHISFRVGAIGIADHDVVAAPRLGAMLHVQQTWIEVGMDSFPLLLDLFEQDPEVEVVLPSVSLGVGWMLARGHHVSPMLGGEMRFDFEDGAAAGATLAATVGVDLMAHRHLGFNVRYLPGVGSTLGGGETGGDPDVGLVHSLRAEAVFLW